MSETKPFAHAGGIIVGVIALWLAWFVVFQLFWGLLSGDPESAAAG